MKFPFMRMPVSELKAQYDRRGIKLKGDSWVFYQGLLWHYVKDLKLPAKQWIKVAAPEIILSNTAALATYINHPKLEIRVQHLTLVSDMAPTKFNISFEVKASEDMTISEPLIGILPI